MRVFVCAFSSFSFLSMGRGREVREAGRNYHLEKEQEEGGTWGGWRRGGGGGRRKVQEEKKEEEEMDEEEEAEAEGG